MTDSAGNYTTASTTRPAAASKTRPSSARILLLDAEGRDRELSQDEFDHESLSDQRLVWVDMPSGSKDRDLARDRAFLEHLGAPEDALDALLEVVGRPRLFEYGDVMRLEVTGLTQPVNESIEESKPVAVLCVVGPNWLVTVHDAPVAFLEEFRERVEGDSDLGDLDAVAFLATLLDWQLTSYDEEIRRIIATLDELEDQALRDSASQQETLEQLVSLRRRISRLRALLAPHEPVFAQLARPEFDRLSTSDSAEAFRTLADRAAASVAIVESAREMLLGTFEILMTRTAQKTNDIVKLLTILTVMLLPSTLIAGILGMNFHPSFFDTPSLFWAAIGLMILTMSITLITIRRRGWLSEPRRRDAAYSRPGRHDTAVPTRTATLGARSSHIPRCRRGRACLDRRYRVDDAESRALRRAVVELDRMHGPLFRRRLRSRVASLNRESHDGLRSPGCSSCSSPSLLHGKRDPQGRARRRDCRCSGGFPFRTALSVVHTGFVGRPDPSSPLGGGSVVRRRRHRIRAGGGTRSGAATRPRSRRR